MKVIESVQRKIERLDSEWQIESEQYQRRRRFTHFFRRMNCTIHWLAHDVLWGRRFWGEPMSRQIREVPALWVASVAIGLAILVNWIGEPCHNVIFPIVF